MKKFLFYLIQFTWGLPQNLVGLIGYLILYKKNRHERYQNAFFTLVDTDKSFGGISLGVFIFINGKKDENWKHDTRIHDRRENDGSYYTIYCEGWANLWGSRFSGQTFVTQELLQRGRFGKPWNQE